MSRRTVVALGLLALVVVCILIAVLVRTRPTPSPVPAPTPSPSATVTAKSLLVAVRDDTGEMADTIVMGAEAEPVTGSWLSMQPGLGVDVDATGTLTLAEVGPKPPTESTTLVSNQLGVTVAGGWVMDRLAFAAIVDSVGGVVVDLAAPVVQVNPDGTKTVLAKAGQRRIYGPAAAQYVITLAPKEPQSARMQRFDQVWAKVVRQLPGNVDRVRSIVGSLGSSSRISATPDYIANLLLDYQTAMAERTEELATLPALGTGVGATAVFTLEPQPMVEVAKKLFAASVTVPGKNGALPRIRVVSEGVSNATFVTARQVVSDAGFTFVWAGSRPRSTTSRVFVANSAAKKTLGIPLAEALGLPTSAIQVSTDQTVGSQATVLLGLDAFTVSASPSATSATSSVTASP